MANLTAEAMSAWLDRLPEDFRRVVTDEVTGDEERIRELSLLLSNTAAERVLDVVIKHADDFVAMGRARRIRFLAWVSGQTYPDSGLLFRHLSEGSEESETGGGAGKVAPYFAADLEALNQAVASRYARRTGTISNLAVVLRSSYEIQGEAELRQGGGL